MSDLKVHIYPLFRGEDRGDGGVRRVAEAQSKHLPAYGIEVVDTAEEAEVIACHITAPEAYFKNNPDKAFVAHNHGLYWAEYNWENWALKANKTCMELIRSSDAVTAPSYWVAHTLRRHTMRKVDVVWHGIDLEDWEPTQGDWGYVLWNKNRPDDVCDPRVVNALAAMMPYQQFVTTYGKETDNVKITGRVSYPEAKEILQHAGIYLCTVRETFGIGTLEAMAAGVPVVGWNWGGQKEFIKHKETGWLSEPNDYAGLEEGIHWIQEHRDEIVANAKQDVVERFQWKNVISQYADIYHRVAKSWYQKKPKVSVIVTAYNLAEFLPACLDSVVKQSMTDWECIVVDDASPDTCGDIADEYAEKDSRFKSIHNEENQYLAGARNTGITAAKGKYILPLDADDMISPDTLHTLSGVLDSDKMIHIAYGNVGFVELNGDIWHSGWPMEFRHDWQLMQRNLLPYCSMYRREVWEATAGYRSRCRTAEDADFWSRASSFGFRPAMVTKQDTLIYRNRSDGMGRIEGTVNWASWFPWSYIYEVTPAGAVTEEQTPIYSLVPPAISIIIPVGPGHGQLARDAVDSVDAQTFRRWECIVVNDSGEDLPLLPSWVNVVEAPRDHRVGVAAARNLGIGVSESLLFLPLDADDYLQPEALETLYNIQQQEGGVVYSDWWEEWEDGTIKVWQTPDYDATKLVGKGCIHAITALYPKDAWEKVGGFDEEIEAWEDWDFQLALANIGVCETRIDRPLFTYRKYSGQRRDENYADFESSKQAILSKWGSLWRGEKELMACRGCPGGGGRGTVRRSPPMMRPDRRELPDPEKVVVVEYMGNAMGATNFRGPSGAIYLFDGTDSGRRKYVLREDAILFSQRVGFRILDLPEYQKEEIVKAEIEESKEPVLTAPGPPKRE